MIVCGNAVFAICDKDDPATIFMREFDENHVELKRWAYYDGIYDWWGFSLDSAEWTYGPATWVCPD